MVAALDILLHQVGQRVDGRAPGNEPPGGAPVEVGEARRIVQRRFIQRLNPLQQLALRAFQQIPDFLPRAVPVSRVDHLIRIVLTIRLVLSPQRPGRSPPPYTHVRQHIPGSPMLGRTGPAALFLR